MKKNMGTADRIIRLIIAAAAVILFATGTLSGTLGIIALVVAGIFTLTSVVRYCPIYHIVGLSTCPASAGK